MNVVCRPAGVRHERRFGGGQGFSGAAFIAATAWRRAANR